jgi:hypothetical protein
MSASFPGRITAVSTEHEAEWTSEPVPAGIRTPDRPAPSPVTIRILSLIPVDINHHGNQTTAAAAAVDIVIIIIIIIIIISARMFPVHCVVTATLAACRTVPEF